MNLSMVPPIFVGDRRHLGEIFVEELRQQFGLKPLGGRGEVLDVGEEDGELLALGVDGDVLLAGEDALVDLRRDVARDLHRERGEEVVGGFELLVHALDAAGLAALEREERQAAAGGDQEIGQQEFEREDVGRDRLGDDHLLNASDVTDLPVLLRALGMAVVAADAGRAHRHGRDEADLVGEQRGGGLDDLLLGIPAQRVERVLLELVELVRGAVLEREVRDEAVGDVFLLCADHPAELQRQRRRNRDRAGHGFIVVHDLGRAVRIGEDPPDHIGRIIATHARDYRIEIRGLASQRGLAQLGQVEPYRERQSEQEEGDHGTDQDAVLALFFGDRLFHLVAPLCAFLSQIWRICGPTCGRNRARKRAPAQPHFMVVAAGGFSFHDDCLRSILTCTHSAREIP